MDSVGRDHNVVRDSSVATIDISRFDFCLIDSFLRIQAIDPFQAKARLIGSSSEEVLTRYMTTLKIATEICRTIAGFRSMLIDGKLSVILYRRYTIIIPVI